MSTSDQDEPLPPLPPAVDRTMSIIESQLTMSVQFGRTLGLNAAITIVERFALTGDSAETALKALRHLKEIMNQKLDG